VIQRGSHAEIDIFPGEPCNNKLAGNVVDICPVGALCSKDFLYKQRVWWLDSKRSVCPNCSTGCSIHVDQNDDIVYRLKPRFNPLAQGHFMCDEGRFGFKYIHDERRLGQPHLRTEGKLAPTTWERTMPALRAAIEGAVTAHRGGFAAVLSPWMTCEEAYLLAGYLKSLSAHVQLALGPVRVVGEDDQFPKDVHGKAVQPTKFTIRAEKCPNRRGIEAVLEHFQGAVTPMDELWGRLQKRQIDALYLLGGDPAPWLSAEQAAQLDGLKLLIVQDILPSPAIPHASFVLPGGSFAEKDGTFVNHSGLAQAIHKSVVGPHEARPDGRILWELAGRRGLFHAANLRKEIGGAIPALAGLAAGNLGEYGVPAAEPPVAPASDQAVAATRH
jgi:NADH-quinone oxidoreductase subunit G